MGGKTTFSRQLRKKAFRYRHDSTHGIEIEPWTLPKKDFPETLQKKIAEAIREHKEATGQDLELPETLQLNLWDFGGQEYYHATYRLFINSNVLYLLLWEKDTDEQDEEKGQYPRSYWLENIQYYATKNITLIIQNKVKGVAEGIDALHYKITYRDKLNEESINQYKSDIKELKKRILHQLVNLSYLGEAFPKIYDDIRQELRKITDKFISYEAYTSICLNTDRTEKKIMVKASQRETLLRFLDDTGAVICFRFREKTKKSALKEYVFTDPVWLTKVIYEILVKEQADFDEQHVVNVVSKYELNAWLWIEMMKQFELIFEITKEGATRYVVPQYLPVNFDNPQAYKMAKAGKQMKLAFILHYPGFLPKSNFLRLVAKYGQKNIDYLFRKKNLLFFLYGKTVECLVNSVERKIIIEIQDNDKFIANELFETLLAIDYPKDLQVSVNEKEFVQVKKLREKVTNKNLEIDTINGSTIAVGDFRFLFEKRKEDISAKSAVIKKEIRIFVSYSSKDREIRDLLINGLMSHLSQTIDFKFIFWTDEEIDQGSNWEESIEIALTKSVAALLLVSASFAASPFIQENELADFFKRKEENGYLMLPVLVRKYNFGHFEKLSGLHFFKTYFSEYEFTNPNEEDRLLPFDKLMDIADYVKRKRLLNEYCYNLAETIRTAIENKFK